MKKLTMIDLCSGLGGASQPFIDRDWNVLRIDNNPKFQKIPKTIIMNVKDIIFLLDDYKLDTKFLKPDFIWASPPCNCFSIASIHLHWTKRRKPKHIGVINAIRNVVWCLDAIELFNPKFWLLENPRAKLRNILNKPGVIYPGFTTDLGLWGAKSPKPTDIWGELPEITLPCVELGNNTLPDNDVAHKNNLAVSINGNEKNYLESINGYVKNKKITSSVKGSDYPDQLPGDVYQASTYGNAKKKWNNQSSRKEMRALIPYKLGETIAIEIEKYYNGGSD